MHSDKKSTVNSPAISRVEIYCDMDGVLVDFNTSFKELTDGRLYDAAVEHYGLKEVWRRIGMEGLEWWANLKWLSDGKKLWNFIEDKNPKILTAAATSLIGDKAVIGKQLWCKRELGPSIEVIMANKGPDKDRWSAPNRILIDDLKDNIKAWRDAGGIGILHRNADQTIEQLKQYITPLEDENALEEDWRSLAAAGMMGLATMKGMAASKADIKVPLTKVVRTAADYQIKPEAKPQTASNVSMEQLLMSYENSKDNPKGGYNSKVKKWYPHKSLEGGTDTIAYGHKLQAGEDFSKGITDQEAIALLRQDISKRELQIQKALPSYNSYPQYLKNAIMSGWYRGDLGPTASPKTIRLMKANKWIEASKEYLNHDEFKSGENLGVVKRMQDNSNAFATYGKQLDSNVSKKSSGTSPT